MSAALDKETLTVCVLDDDPSVLKAMSRLLSAEGWKVQSFLDPIVFLSYADAHRPEVVVLDILMPIMNGLEVQAQLRTLSPSTRVLILTSKNDPSVRSKAIDAGASAFFLKPVNGDDFLAAIESAVSDIN
jgi:FixJ family two-component response regulator